MVDVVSCIDVLANSKRSSDIPAEFTALKEPLMLCNLPLDPRVVTINPAPASATANMVSKNSRDQAKAATNKEVQQMAVMLLAMVQFEVGYEPSNPVSTKEAVKAVEKALFGVGIGGRYGMSSDRIKKALLKGYNGLQTMLTEDTK